DTYATERIPHVRATIAFSMELGRVICIADPAEAAARDAAMTAAAKDGHEPPAAPTPRIRPGGAAADDAPAGARPPQARVEHRGATGLFDDVVGRGWTLVAAAGDPLRALDPDAAAYFASLGGVGAHVGPDAAVRDVDGAYRRWFDRAGVA